MSLNQGGVWECSHLKDWGWWICLHDGLLTWLGCWCWLWEEVSVPHNMHLAIGLLDYFQYMIAVFPQSKSSKRGQSWSPNIFHDISSKVTQYNLINILLIIHISPNQYRKNIKGRCTQSQRSLGAILEAGHHDWLSLQETLPKFHFMIFRCNMPQNCPTEFLDCWVIHLQSLIPHWLAANGILTYSYFWVAIRNVQQRNLLGRGRQVHVLETESYQHTENCLPQLRQWT